MFSDLPNCYCINTWEVIYINACTITVPTPDIYNSTELAKPGDRIPFTAKFVQTQLLLSRSDQEEPKTRGIKEKKQEKREYVRPPFNYTGGKYSLLPQILPLLPSNIGYFYDVFCGGCSVAVNTDAELVFCSDVNQPLVSMLRKVKEAGAGFPALVEWLVAQYSLTKTNEAGYLSLREYHNSLPDDSLLKGAALFTLLAFAFNHQIRFNKKGEFNTSFGKNRSSFNPTMQKNLDLFIENIPRLQFRDADFETVIGGVIKSPQETREKSFVYCDPPYLISTATYNESGGWNKEDDGRLFTCLDRCNERGVRFALSNVTEHGGEVNALLVEWSGKYRTVRLDKKYENCSYHKKERRAGTTEVLIVNYDKKGSLLLR